MSNAALPTYTTPDELADHLGWSPRRVRSLARGLGVARVMGNRIVLLPQDVEAIMEASRCRSKSTSVVKSGTSEARLPDGDYEALRGQRARKRPCELPQPQNSERGIVVSIRKDR
jgi:hypothetical protein